MYKRPLNRGFAQGLGTTARLGVLVLGGTLWTASAVQAQTAEEGDKVLPEVRVNALVKGQALDESQRAFSVTEFRRDEIREQPGHTRNEGFSPELVVRGSTAPPRPKA